MRQYYGYVYSIKIPTTTPSLALTTLLFYYNNNKNNTTKPGIAILCVDKV